MRNVIAVSAFTLAFSLAAPIAGAAELSVKTWARDLKKALGKGDAKAVSEMMDPAALAKTYLERNASPDLETMKKARRLFAREKLKEAVETYDKIPKGSEYWLESVEEKGWTFHREKSYDKTLAQTKTLLSSPFVAIVGSEPFFLQSLSQLKICDYKGVLETHQLFKDSQRQRVIDIQTLSKEGTSPAVEQVIDRTDHFPMTLKAAGEAAKSLPRLFYRDLEIQKALMAMKLAESARGLAADAQGAAAGSFRAGLAKLEKAARSAPTRVKSRLKSLAKAENEENFKMLQKLNLIEVETIQRMHADLALDKDSYSKGEFRKASVDELVFPDDGHPWMDELDKYQFKVNSCPQNLRRRM